MSNARERKRERERERTMREQRESKIEWQERGSAIGERGENFY